MESIMYYISQVLGITIIHSLWQGMLVYFILRIVLSGAPALSAVKKYNLAIFALISITACFIYTLSTEIFTYNWVTLNQLQPDQLLPSFNLPVNSHFKPGFYEQIAVYMPYVCAIYFAGLLANVLKLGWEWNKIRQIKQSLIEAEQMQQFINKFSKKLDITKRITLKFSALIDVPCMMGYIKPLILLPVSLSVHLSACEVEAILLHELSHIKRNDYLVNLLQQAISVMLFFNPFTLLINRVINHERENSCDDLVVEKTGKPLIYAQALLKLEEARAHNLQLALAITGKKFHLLKRIERIMKTQKQIGNIRNLFIAVLLFAGALSGIAWFSPANAKVSTVKVKKTAPADNGTIVSTPDSIQYTQVSDTAKHKKATKNQTAYKKHTSKASPKTYKKIKSDEATDDTVSMAKFYGGAEWRAQMEAMRKQGEEMRKKFDSPEWKEQMEAMRKQGEEIRKKFDSPEWKEKMEAMRKQGDEMRKKFDSPEWKEQMANIRKQGEEMRKKFDSPEWKEQMLAMRKQGEEMRKKFDSPEWRAQMDSMKKQTEEIKTKFESPEWKEQMANMKKQAFEMKKQFDSPEWKEQVKNMKKQSDMIKKQFNSPEWKEQKELMKKQREEWKNTWKDKKWKLKDTVGNIKIYEPKKDSI